MVRMRIDTFGAAGCGSSRRDAKRWNAPSRRVS
jgi:hypothetical protein